MAYNWNAIQPIFSVLNFVFQAFDLETKKLFRELIEIFDNDLNDRTIGVKYSLVLDIKYDLWIYGYISLLNCWLKYTVISVQKVGIEANILVG